MVRYQNTLVTSTAEKELVLLCDKARYLFIWLP